MTRRLRALAVLTAAGSIVIGGLFHPDARAQETNLPAATTDLDRRVRGYLESHRGQWRDLNVPEADGRALYDLIIQRGYTRAVEIGTSTGHSTIWIAWALARTGGRVTTIEIDPQRHAEALQHFTAAGLAPYIDARLGNAHDLVPQMSAPVDFVFSDADKEWYTNYFKALWPHVTAGGCFTAHNVTRSSRMRGIRDYVAHLATVADAQTTFTDHAGAGMAITCKTVTHPATER